MSTKSILIRLSKVDVGHNGQARPPLRIYNGPPTFRLATRNSEGSFSGIGVSFTIMDDTITVNRGYLRWPGRTGGPHARLDRIVTIDDSVANRRPWPTKPYIVDAQGTEGSTVKLGIKRSSAPTVCCHLQWCVMIYRHIT